MLWSVRTLWGCALAATLLVGCFESRSTVDSGPSDDAGADCNDGRITAPAHCRERRNTTCLRERVAARIDDVEYADCVNQTETLCEGATWPAGCSPSCDESRECIELLRRSDLIGTPTEDLLMMVPDCSFCE